MSHPSFFQRSYSSFVSSPARDRDEGILIMIMSLSMQTPAAEQLSAAPTIRSRASLAPIFHPRGVAIIGATEKPSSVGRTVLKNLLDQPFGATIFPVNPKRNNVLGI